ncbi:MULTISPECIES: 16S rRNA (adenine(1518)-N(6)/adenine(1519)-N(6))-dimethyltransferase RsmA [Helicobacter]|uniref:16S rRNA (Adenine(1518)-N(6)/adenine(1519)-N(6))-dimethyltransferase RsmA n=1 Tax=Helicobacter ibis TaxID=2962633 RepID=A0ABT4VF06_9HELI|nr:16S rRNA (adenine(1518)-N(6)/adenine(1519)-N(6))-dimethyltransferase RsmA [Helicobacter ibis]MDA3969294.1 16S rRNA (adenine(1518)-N(6)/adenine(1519)-N(6))-dimethyltransferase RsmA [Helicobacter ibis]
MQDEIILTQIIQSIPKDVRQYKILEIGAGLGDLTNKLLSLGSITAYEVDMELVPHLQRRFSDALKSKQLQLKLGDILEYWKGETLENEKYFLVSNLPYYIATLLIVKVLKDPFCKGCVVMTQKEVAEKFCADVFGSSFGALSILTQSVGVASYLFSVPKEAFSPPPKVTSAVFLIQKTKNYESLDKLEAMLKIAFTSPRKTLLNNLSKTYKNAKDILQKLNIPINSRPHEVDTDTYHRLLKFL